MHILTSIKGQGPAVCYLWYYPKVLLSWISLCSRNQGYTTQMGRKGQSQHRNDQANKADTLLQKPPLWKNNYDKL